MHSAPLPKSYLQRVSPPPVSKSRAAKRRRLNTSVEGGSHLHQARSYTLAHSSPDLYESEPTTEIKSVTSQRASLVEKNLTRPSTPEVSLDAIVRSPDAAEQDEAQSPASLSAPKTLAPAAIEAGHVTVQDHLSYFVNHFQSILSTIPVCPTPSLRLEHFSDLFTRNSGVATGHHFVIHQHDHPRAGLHYDLRLQISESSSASWSVPYGLPGNPNERKRYGRRQAIETRVHALWNHLVESAGPKTGSILIWDTGIYKVLPYDRRDSDATDSGNEDCDEETEAQRLCAAFRRGKIRVQLQGSKLPPGYTISIALSPNVRKKVEPHRTNPSLKRELSNTSKAVMRQRAARRLAQDSDEEDQKLQDINMDSDDDEDDRTLAEKQSIRVNNAYPGSHNTIGSVHQRWWFVHLDKAACGFTKGRDESGRVLWRMDDEDLRHRYPFYVKGRDCERSVITGRKAADVHRDEGSVGYTPRAGWRPILN